MLKDIQFTLKNLPEHEQPSYLKGLSDAKEFFRLMDSWTPESEDDLQKKDEILKEYCQLCDYDQLKYDRVDPLGLL